jgi:Mpv17 / PMP22 family
MFGNTAGPLLASAKRLIKHHPTLFNGITGGTLCAVSDAGAQQIEAPKGTSKSFNLRRFFAAGVLGIFFGGFVYPTAYHLLDARFHAKNLQTLFTKSLVEIATVGIFVNTISMTSRGILVGRDGKDVLKHVVQEMPKVTMNDVKVWLPYNLLAFSVIPAVVRPTTTILMEASWQTYISLRSNDYERRAAEIRDVTPTVKLS